jgi:hypothetical protein
MHATLIMVPKFNILSFPQQKKKKKKLDLGEGGIPFLFRRIQGPVSAERSSTQSDTFILIYSYLLSRKIKTK